MLIYLIALGMLSLSAITIRSDFQSNAMSEAKANARLALMIAIGQLQEHAGPDQRITGTADLAGDGSGMRLASGASPDNVLSIDNVNNGLSAVQPGTRYWTGVWGNGDPSAPIAGNRNIYEKTPSPKLLGWLVSGNEGGSFETSTDPASFGQVLKAGTNIHFTPAGATTGIGSSGKVTITDASGKAHDAVVLLGSGSAGNVTRTFADGSVENPEDRYVAAPLVSVGKANHVTGNYAFWVSDEGAKARLDLVDSYAEHTDTSADPKARYRLMTAPRTGLEILPPFALGPYLNWSQHADEDNSPMSKVITYKQVPLMDQANLMGSGGDPAAITGPLFHALTTYSTGILADSLNGGLRRDLTAAFKVPSSGNWNNWSGSGANWTGTNGQSAGAGQSIIPPAYSPTLKGLIYSGGIPHSNYSHPTGAKVPRWDVLYDFHNLFNQTQANGAVPARAAKLGDLGLSPQILQVRMLLGADATAGRNVRFLFTPMIVLGNPYVVPLKLENLKLRFWLANAPGPYGKRWANGVQDCITNFNFSTSAGAGGYGWGRTAIFSYETMRPTDVAWPPSVTGDADFAIPTTTIEPGQTKVFSLSAVQQYSNSNPIQLTEGQIAAFASAYHYLWKDSGIASPAYTPSGGPLYFGTISEADGYTPMKAQIVDLSDAVIQEIESLNLDVVTNSFGILRSPTGATAPAGSSDGAKLIAAFYFDQITPGNFFDLGNHSDNSVRPYADFNSRAAFIRHTNRMNLSGGAWRNAYAGLNYRDSSTSSEINIANGTSPAYPPPTFTSNLDPVLWGRVDHRPPVNTPLLEPVFFDLPGGEIPVLSLGDLQQANVTADDIRVNVGHQPANAIGNSYATPFVRRELVKQERTDEYFSRHAGLAIGAHHVQTNYYDLSYLLNAALWDGYYFSGTPSNGGFIPNNPRLELLPEASATTARDVVQAAGQTVINGAFNINSTSVEAWTVLLAGMRNLPKLPSGASTSAGTSMFPRTLSQTEDALETPTGNGSDSYSGFRSLTDDQVKALAEAIVKQVRLRGPFVSLGHFVNRALVPVTGDTKKLGFAGALQTAIDMTTVNDFSRVSKEQLDPPLSDNLSVKPSNNEAYNFYAYSEPPDSNASLFTSNSVRAQRSAGIPGWLTQADVLKAIGPVISSRSDTFVIRSYGNAVNPVTGAVVAQAWCEAVVQRQPEYMDSKSDPATAAPADTIAINQLLGRRFEIISFRWLSPDEV